MTYNVFYLASYYGHLKIGRRSVFYHGLCSAHRVSLNQRINAGRIRSLWVKDKFLSHGSPVTVEFINMTTFQRVDKLYSRISLGMSCRCAVRFQNFHFIPGSNEG